MSENISQRNATAAWVKIVNGNVLNPTKFTVKDAKDESTVLISMIPAGY